MPAFLKHLVGKGSSAAKARGCAYVWRDK